MKEEIAFGTGVTPLRRVRLPLAVISRSPPLFCVFTCDRVVSVQYHWHHGGPVVHLLEGCVCQNQRMAVKAIYYASVIAIRKNKDGQRVYARNAVALPQLAAESLDILAGDRRTLRGFGARLWRLDDRKNAPVMLEAADLPLPAELPPEPDLRGFVATLWGHCLPVRPGEGTKPIHVTEGTEEIPY